MSILCGMVHIPLQFIAYFRNLQGQTISLLILLYLCVCPKNCNSFKSVWAKQILVHGGCCGGHRTLHLANSTIHRYLTVNLVSN